MSDNQKPNIKSEPSSHDVSNSAQNFEKLSIKPEPKVPSGSGMPPPSTSQTSAQPAKRVFVPNLAVDRSKREVKTEPEQQEKNKQPRRPAMPNLNAARGRGRGQQNLIQSHSIFEAGPGESTRRYVGNKDSNESYSRVVGSTSSERASSSSVKREPSDSYDNRVKLEQSLLIEDIKEEESPVYIKLKHDFKDETVADSSDKTKSNEAESKDDKLLRYIFDPSEESQKTEKLILFQIPENFQLNELAEGQIGKIRIRQSGKIELVINDNRTLNLCPSVSGAFLQDAVALEVNPGTNEKGEATGKITNMGHVFNKIVCSPKF